VKRTKKVNAVERSKSEVLTSIHGGKNVSGRSAVARRVRIKKMVSVLGISKAIKSTQVSRSRAAKQLSEANKVMKKQGWKK